MKSIRDSVQFLKGVGPKRADLLKKIGIITVEDLLYYLPRELDDRSKYLKFRDALNNQLASFKVEVLDYPNISRPKPKLIIIKIPVTDGYDQAKMVFFNQEFLKDYFKPGQVFNIYGKVNKSYGNIEISSPIYEREGLNSQVGRIIPIYNLTKGITNKTLSKIIDRALDDYNNYITNIVPEEYLKKYNLMDRREALSKIHKPRTIKEYKRARASLAYEELLVYQLVLLGLDKSDENKDLYIKYGDDKYIYKFIENLPFELTKAQKRVIDEIINDMEDKKQMTRLIQGDVGSGKTIIAIISLLKAVRFGYQGALLVPTEILAKQHYNELLNFLEKEGIRIELLVGSLKEREKEDIRQRIKTGEIDILVGTHAIIQDDLEFKKLGLTITDEQHRFGVRQRESLVNKGNKPDILVMTATPIPRTLALFLYGDLDISIIDELPPGRQKIETYSLNFSMVDRINNFIIKNINDGRQAYIVAPLIEESEKLNIKSSSEIYEELSKGPLKEYNVALLHGKMKDEEKESTMNDFIKGEIDVLVSTTVIEVGVNISNANLMVIYNAERFGLAQLHQLRGRVGRGKHKSYCILVNNAQTKEAIERMRIMQDTGDGFVIAEKDLVLRGPGEFFGTRQHGISEFKVANIARDFKIVQATKLDSQELIKRIDDYPNLKNNVIDKIDYFSESI